MLGAVLAGAGGGGAGGIPSLSSSSSATGQTGQQSQSGNFTGAGVNFGANNNTLLIAGGIALVALMLWRKK